MEIVIYILSYTITVGSLYLVYRLMLKMAGKTKLMKKIKSLLDTKAAKAGIVVGTFIWLIEKFLQIP